MEICDHCGPAVRASYRASKGNKELTFCAHHAHAIVVRLVRAGWTVTEINAPARSLVAA